jgi:hypothetical protein
LLLVLLLLLLLYGGLQQFQVHGTLKLLGRG